MLGVIILSIKRIMPLISPTFLCAGEIRINLPYIFAKADIRLVMDFVPNHTSAQHEWFLKSRRKEMPFKDYYVWHPGHPERKVKHTNGEEIPAPPNNWVAVFNGPMWDWDEVRKEYYLHQFMIDQPDLDFRNPDVRKRIEQTMRFWFDKGCDGLRIDAMKHVFESQNIVDNDEWADPHAPTDNPVGDRSNAI